MTVAGVSMALVQREEFISSLRQSGGGLSNLIRQLQVKMTAQDFAITALAGMAVTPVGGVTPSNGRNDLDDCA